MTLNLPNYDLLVKTILIGDAGVGKSSFCNKFINNNFYLNYESTIGVDFFTKVFDLGSKKIKLQIWDTAGQERFRSIITSYFRNAKIILYFIDLSDPSCINQFKKWDLVVNRHVIGTEVKKVIIGNKIDLGINCNIDELVSEIGDIPFLQISVKKEDNFNSFINLITNLVQNFPIDYNNFETIKLEDKKIKKKSFCNIL